MGQAKFLNPGNSVNYTPTSAVAEGQVVVQDQLVGVAERPIPANVLGALTVRGVFDVVKANEQIAAGAKVYWDADGNPYNGVAGTGCLTTSAGGNTYAGKTIELAAATDERVLTRLEDVAAITNTVHNALTAVIADPGASGAIPVTDSGNCQLVSAAAETRTLAAPTFAGQVICLNMKTRAVGDITLTVASTVNQTGNNTLVFGAARDCITLIGVYSGANLVWSTLANDGVALSTV